MSTINKKTQLYKYAVAAVLIVILAAAQITTAEELWKRSGTTLEPNDTAQDDINDVTNVTMSGTITAGNFKTTGCTASGTKTVAHGNTTIASGSYSAAFGDSTTASGSKAAAFGKNTTASGDYATAFGLGTRARGSGSFAAGYSADNPNTLIDANGIGSLALGYAGGTTTFGTIKAWNNGSIAMGYAINDSNIYSSGKGSIAMGDANGMADILATDDGAFAAGYAYNGTIQSTNQGSIAMGYVSDSNIYSQGKGSIAMGNAASGRTIQSNGTGSIAMGYAYDGDTKAIYDGAVAIGNGVVADACDAFAIGKSFTNSTKDRFAVGFGQKDLEVWSGNAKINGNLAITDSVSPSPISGEPNEKEIFFPADYANTIGDYKTKTTAASGSWRFDFAVPYDYNSTSSLKLVGIVSSGAAGTAYRNIYLYSDYAASGETYNTHDSNSVARCNLSSYSSKLYGMDISGVFTNIQAGDNCGLNVTHKSIGGNIDYLGVVLRYKTKKYGY